VSSVVKILVRISGFGGLTLLLAASWALFLISCTPSNASQQPLFVNAPGSPDGPQRAEQCFDWRHEQ